MNSSDFSQNFHVPRSTVRPRFTQPAKMRKRVIARPVGSSVRLKCTASGTPRPDIVWLKDDQPLSEQKVGEGRQKKWTLSLKNLTPEHSGRYTCRVSNRAGEINATYKVEVIREYHTELNAFITPNMFTWKY